MTLHNEGCSCIVHIKIAIYVIIIDRFVFLQKTNRGFTVSKPEMRYTKIVTYILLFYRKLANENVLKFDIRRYSSAITHFLGQLEKQFGKTWQSRNINIGRYTIVMFCFFVRDRPFNLQGRGYVFFLKKIF